MEKTKEVKKTWTSFYKHKNCVFKEHNIQRLTLEIFHHQRAVLCTFKTDPSNIPLLFSTRRYFSKQQIILLRHGKTEHNFEIISYGKDINYKFLFQRKEKTLECIFKILADVKKWKKPDIRKWRCLQRKKTLANE